MVSLATAETYAQLHHYFTDPVTGADTFDEEGEVRLGWYWQIFKRKTPISDLVGPYHTQCEADTACKAAFHTGIF